MLNFGSCHTIVGKDANIQIYLKLLWSTFNFDIKISAIRTVTMVRWLQY